MPDEQQKSSDILPLNPLTESDREIIERNKRRIADLQPLIEKLEAAGLNCEQHREACEALQRFFQGVEAEFLGPRPDEVSQ